MKNNVFTQNPNLKSYHETADCFKFFRPQDAQVHARGLKNKAIKEVTRGSLMVDEVIAEVKAKKIKEIEASKTPEAPNTPEVKNAVLPIPPAGTHTHIAPKDVAPVDQPAAPETLTPMALAKLRVEAIDKLETVEAVEEVLKGETAKSVIKAGAAKIEALNAAE